VAGCIHTAFFCFKYTLSGGAGQCLGNAKVPGIKFWVIFYPEKWFPALFFLSPSFTYLTFSTLR
jgi:hypothetical protein